MRWLDRLARRETPDVAAQTAAAYEAAGRNDYATALEIWNTFAHAGVARAQNDIGACFPEGLGVERDAHAAAAWWRKAATLGDADGQAMLGAAYHLGAGVERDIVEAFAWLTRAREGGSGLAGQFLDAVRQLLSPDQAAEAARRAALPLEAA